MATRSMPLNPLYVWTFNWEKPDIFNTKLYILTLTIKIKRFSSCLDCSTRNKYLKSLKIVHNQLIMHENVGYWIEKNHIIFISLFQTQIQMAISNVKSDAMQWNSNFTEQLTAGVAAVLVQASPSGLQLMMIQAAYHWITKPISQRRKLSSGCI